MSQRHHTISYVEIKSVDLERDKRFYSEAFGWQFNDYGPQYAGIRDADSDGEVGGLLAADATAPGGPLVLLFSADLDESVAAVTKAGGAVINGPYAFPGGRRFHFTDPSGNELGVFSEA